MGLEANEKGRGMEGARPEQSAFGYTLALVAGWRWIVLCATASAAVALALLLFSPNWFRARSSFIAESRSGSRMPAALAGLASQFGVNIGSDPARSPSFYASMIVSEPIIDTVLLSPLPRSAQSDPDSASLLDSLRIPPGPEARRLDRGRRVLRKMLSVHVEPRTSVVTIEVEARQPVLAAYMADRFVQELARFEVEVRQSQARARRDFAAREGEQIRGDLLAAEDSLRRFYERNREYRNSPTLVFEEGRLRRQVDLQQELYLMVRRELEAAKIDAVNDAPTITVLARARPPLRKSRPHRFASAVAAGLLGGILAAISLILRHRTLVLEEDRPGAIAAVRSAFKSGFRN